MSNDKSAASFHPDPHVEQRPQPKRPRSEFADLIVTDAAAVDAYARGEHIVILGSMASTTYWINAHLRGMTSLGLTQVRRLVHSGDYPERLRGLRGPISVVDIGMPWQASYAETCENVRIANLVPMPYLEPPKIEDEYTVYSSAPAIDLEKIARREAAVTRSLAVTAVVLSFAAVIWSVLTP